MNQDTLDKMRHMRLFGMHRAFRSSLESPTHEQLTADEMTTLLVDSEWDERHNRSIERSKEKPTITNLGPIVGQGGGTRS